ncbi:hypothetical protein ABK040_016637 [Willaertia magna]
MHRKVFPSVAGDGSLSPVRGMQQTSSLTSLEALDNNEDEENNSNGSFSKQPPSTNNYNNINTNNNNIKTTDSNNSLPHKSTPKLLKRSSTSSMLNLKDYARLKKPRNKFLDKIFTISNLIIIIVISLIILSNVSIFIASIITSVNIAEDAANEYSIVMADNVYQFLTSVLNPVKLASTNLAEDWNRGVISENDFKGFQSYLFNKFKRFNTTTFGLAEVLPTSRYYSYIQSFAYGNDPVYLFSYQPAGNSNSTVYNVVDLESGLIDIQKSSIRSINANYNVSEQNYYKEVMRMYGVLYNKPASSLYEVPVVFADPYLPNPAVDKELSIYCSTLLFNRTKIKNNEPNITDINNHVGVVKVNVGLRRLDEYLKQLTFPGEGYMILSNANSSFTLKPNVVIGTSLKNVSILTGTTISKYSIKEYDVGDLLHIADNDPNIPTKIMNTPFLKNQRNIYGITHNGIAKFISKYRFQFENVRWDITIVLYQRDIREKSFVNLYVTVSILVFFILIGILLSFLLAHAVTRPFKKLIQMFQYISILDTENEKIFLTDKKTVHSSVFTEFSLLFLKLYNMLEWLNEIKPFLPEWMLKQLKEELANNANNHSHSSSAFDLHQVLHNNSSSGGSAMKLTADGRLIKNLANNHGASAEFMFETTTQQGRIRSNSSGGYAIPTNYKNSNAITTSNGTYINSSTTTKAKKSNLFKIGLVSKYCTVIMVRFNLNEVFIDAAEEETAELIPIIFPKIYNAIRIASQLCKAEMYMISYEQFRLTLTDFSNITNHNSSASFSDTAFKAIQIANRIQNQITLLAGVDGFLKETFSNRFKCHIGVATGRANCGNLGDSKFRAYAVIGQVIARAKSLLQIASLLDIGVVADETTVQNKRVHESFVFRMIDKIELGVQRSRELVRVYQVLDESKVDDNEWMYELEGKNEKERLRILGEVTEVFNEETLTEEKVDKMKERLKEYQARSEDGLVLSRMQSMISQLEKIKKLEKFKYHSKLKLSLDTYLDYEEGHVLFSEKKDF